jgi:hypothetical protein
MKGNGKGSERYREKLRIDRESLDTAIEEHPGLYLEVQEAHIRAASIRDEQKVATDETYAEVAAAIRKAYEKSGERSTEQRIKDDIAVSKEYLDSVAAFQEAKKEADLLNAMVAAFGERGRMLGKLTDLYIAGYWAQASVRGAGADVRDRKAGDARSAMAESRRARIAK